jgi:hypothetical protein
VGEVGDDSGMKRFHRRRGLVHVEGDHVDLHIFAKELALNAALRDGHDWRVSASFAQGTLRDGWGERTGCRNQRQN